MRVYTPDGTLICLAGLGAGEDVMTFPACFEVGMALGTPHWIRHCRPGDEGPFIAGRYKKLEDADGAEVQPRSLIHVNGRVAELEDLMGMYGTEMTALFSIRRDQDVEESPMADLTGITTPPTPGSTTPPTSESPARVEVATPPFSEEEAEGDDDDPTDIYDTERHHEVSYWEASWGRMVNNIFLRETNAHRCMMSNLRRGSVSTMMMLRQEALAENEDDSAQGEGHRSQVARLWPLLTGMRGIAIPQACCPYSCLWSLWTRVGRCGPI